MITEMYPWIPWELVPELLGSVERTLAVTASGHSGFVVVSLTMVTSLYNATVISLCMTQSLKIHFVSVIDNCGQSLDVRIMQSVCTKFRSFRYLYCSQSKLSPENFECNLVKNEDRLSG